MDFMYAILGVRLLKHVNQGVELYWFGKFMTMWCVYKLRQSSSLARNSPHRGAQPLNNTCYI